MNDRRLKKLFLGFLAFCTIGYSFFALWLYWGYVHLDNEMALKNIEWSIHSIDEDAHQLQASYNYTFKDLSYAGHYIFKKPVFINRLGAEYSIKDFAKDYQKVWVSTNNPADSALQKKYPLKEFVSTIILWGVFLYFLGLNYFASRKVT